MLDESWSYTSNEVNEVQKLFSAGSGLRRSPDKKDETGYFYMDGKPILINESFKTMDGKVYHIGSKTDDSNRTNFYVYLKENPLEIFDLADFDKKAIQLFYATQSI